MESSAFLSTTTSTTSLGCIALLICFVVLQLTHKIKHDIKTDIEFFICNCNTKIWFN
jgi:hypothetical protein